MKCCKKHRCKRRCRRTRKFGNCFKWKPQKGKRMKRRMKCSLNPWEGVCVFHSACLCLCLCMCMNVCVCVLCTAERTTWSYIGWLYECQKGSLGPVASAPCAMRQALDPISRDEKSWTANVFMYPLYSNWVFTLRWQMNTQDDFYTTDIICHHTHTARETNSYAQTQARQGTRKERHREKQAHMQLTTGLTVHGRQIVL